MNALAYFITINTYGNWHGGDARCSVIKEHGTPQIIAARPGLEKYRKTHLKYPPVKFDDQQRNIVLEAFQKVCEYKQWVLLAGHVRSNHAHILVKSPDSVEKVMNTLKAWATRKLRENHYDLKKVWTRHGSTIHLFDTDKIREKAKYIIFEQGKRMACCYDERFGWNDIQGV